MGYLIDKILRLQFLNMIINFPYINVIEIYPFPPLFFKWSFVQFGCMDANRITNTPIITFKKEYWTSTISTFSFSIIKYFPFINYLKI